MRKRKLRVGDRVVIVHVRDGLKEAVDREGTVAAVTPWNVIVVRFDERFSDKLHDGNFSDYKDREERCWQYAPQDLMLVNYTLPSFKDIARLL